MSLTLGIKVRCLSHVLTFRDKGEVFVSKLVLS